MLCGLKGLFRKLGYEQHSRYHGVDTHNGQCIHLRKSLYFASNNSATWILQTAGGVSIFLPVPNRASFISSDRLGSRGTIGMASGLGEPY